MQSNLTLYYFSGHFYKGQKFRIFTSLCGSDGKMSCYSCCVVVLRPR